MEYGFLYIYSILENSDVAIFFLLFSHPILDYVIILVPTYGSLQAAYKPLIRPSSTDSALGGQGHRLKLRSPDKPDHFL